MTVTVEHGFPAVHAPDLWRWLNSPRGPNFDDFGARDYGTFAADLATRSEAQRVWSIFVEGVVVGYAGFVALSPMTGQFRGLVIAPALRCRGIGREAMAQIIAALHAEGFRKLLTMTFADNEPIRRLFLALGFEQQGYLTAATERDGKPLDLRILAYPGAQNSFGL